ncbi:Rv1733c family protein [Streptomyces phaeochromogenes]
MRKVRRTKVRGWRWRTNPLRRHSDAVEAWVVLATWATAMAGGAVAGVVGAQAMESAVERERAGRQPVTAVMLETAPVGVRDVATGIKYDHVKAKVRWTDGNGTAHTAEAGMKPGAKADTEVRVWTDGQGRVVSEPVSREEATARVALAGTGVAMAGCFVILVGGLALRLRVERRATERWGEEWDLVGPQWGPKAG